jgi:uncharacterized protein (TIGR02246 family)
MGDEEAIRSVIRRWMSASESGDLETILKLMTDDVLFMVPGQEPFGKDAFAAAFEGLGDTKISGESDIVELRVLGEWAFIRNHLEVTATPVHGEEVHRAGYTLTLLRKGKDGEWRLARDANLLVARG